MKKLLSLILVLTIILCVNTIGFVGYAKNETTTSSLKDVSVSASTANSSYDWGEKITFNVEVKNNGNETVKNLSIVSTPKRITYFTTEEGESSARITSLAPGESKTVQVYYTANKWPFFYRVFILPFTAIFDTVLGFTFSLGGFDAVATVKVGLFKYRFGFDVKNSENDEDIGQIYSRDFSFDDIVTDADGIMQYIRNEILLVANQSATFDNVKNLANSVGGEIVGYIEITGDYQVAFKNKSETELKSLIQKFKGNSLIDDATLNYVSGISNDAVSVNDGWGGDSWSESNPAGKNWGLEAIRARGAWEYANQMSDIKIGIIDNGFDLNHEELRDIIVWNRDNHIESKNDSVYPGHGSHVLGTFAALTNNGAGSNNGGISGVFPNHLHSNGPNASAYCIDNISAENGQVTSVLSIKEILVELIARNVKVINVSEGLNDWESATFAASVGNMNARTFFKQWSDPIGDLLQRLLDLGYDFVICQSAGNNSATNLLTDKDFVKDSNARFGWKKNTTGSLNSYFGKLDAKYNYVFTAIDNHQDVINRIIVVGAVQNKGDDRKGNHKGYSVASFSNWGDRLDVLAPGVGIYSSNIFGYDSIDGTSQATPHVSGVAAMVWSANTKLKGNEVKSIICNTTSAQITDTFPGSDILFHYDDSHQTNGLLDAQAAVEEAIRRRGSDTNPGFVDQTNGVVVTKIVDAKTNTIPKDDSGKTIAEILLSAYPIVNGVESTMVSATATTDGDGEVFLVAKPGDYKLRVDIPGFLPAVISVKVTANEVLYAEWIKLVRNSTETTESLVYGNVTDAVSGDGIPNVLLTFTDILTGKAVGTTKTRTGNSDGAKGSYSIHLPIGTYRVNATVANYVSTDLTVYSLPQSSTGAEEIVMNPILASGEYRIVLHWGQYPSDLDSHIIGTISNGNHFHVDYTNMSAYDGSTLVANLDRDDRNSYGPETITLKPVTSDTHTYYVYNYTGNSGGTLANSEAWVELYAGSTKKVYHVPTDQGNGRVWSVFSITNGVVKDINNVNDTEPRALSPAKTQFGTSIQSKKN